MADFLNITDPFLATAAVPKRRFFTNPDGSPSFRMMLEQFRDELGMWPCGGKRKRVGAYGLRTIAAKLRRLAQREQLETGWHPLRATADQFEAMAAERGLQSDDTSRAFAVLAMAAGRPAVSTRCHNGCHLMDLVNTGGLQPTSPPRRWRLPGPSP